MATSGYSLAGASDWRSTLLDDIASGTALRQRAVALATVMVLGAGAYGVVLGIWHGPRLAMYCAIKLPLVLLITSAITIVFSWLASTLLGLPLTLAQVVTLNLLTLATAAVLLASVIPIAWLFVFSAPPPTTAQRTAHNLLYLMHTGFIGVCSIGGMRMLWLALRRITPQRSKLVSVFALWFVTYALVGGEVAWALRPFVGSVSAEFPLVFLRPDALRGNVYEFVFTDILPHLLDVLAD